MCARVVCRLAVCAQVMKTMLDRLEREEKQEQKRVRKRETTEERHKRTVQNRLHTTLFKQKETLKKEMLRKRALMEKSLHTEIQVRVSSCRLHLYGL